MGWWWMVIWTGASAARRSRTSPLSMLAERSEQINQNLYYRWSTGALLEARQEALLAGDYASAEATSDEVQALRTQVVTPTDARPSMHALPDIAVMTSASGCASALKRYLAGARMSDRYEKPNFGARTELAFNCC